MRKEHRCKNCGHLLAIERDGKISILCTHRGINTNNKKCDTVNDIPILCDSCQDKII